MNEPPEPVLLVVDDDPLTLMYATGVLEEAGFRIVQAENGDDALAALSAQPDIAAMFLDVRIPGSCNGLELAKRARKICPTARVVITSAYDRPDAAQMAELGTFIAKPYCAEDIARWLRAGAN